MNLAMSLAHKSRRNYLEMDMRIYLVDRLLFIVIGSTLPLLIGGTQVGTACIFWRSYYGSLLCFVLLQCRDKANDS